MAVPRRPETLARVISHMLSASGNIIQLDGPCMALDGPCNHVSYTPGLRLAEILRVGLEF